jgi:hypothetical protein
VTKVIDTAPRHVDVTRIRNAFTCRKRRWRAPETRRSDDFSHLPHG